MGGKKNAGVAISEFYYVNRRLLQSGGCTHATSLSSPRLQERETSVNTSILIEQTEGVAAAASVGGEEMEKMIGRENKSEPRRLTSIALLPSHRNWRGAALVYYLPSAFPCCSCPVSGDVRR